MIKETVQGSEVVIAVLKRKDGTKKVIRERKGFKLLKFLRRIIQ